MDDEAVRDRGDDIVQCRRALDELVTALIRHDLDRAQRRRNDPIRIMSFRAMMDMDRLAFRALTDDPIRSALRIGIRKVGQEIYRQAGMEALHDEFERVAGMDTANEGRRVSAMDSAFNGVGSGDDRWWS